MVEANNWLEIDGSTLEGGGQIFRVSLVLSTLLKKDLKMFKVRAGRNNPGLGNQHLQGFLSLQEMTQAEVTGAIKGNQEITYKGSKIGEINLEKFKVQQKTPGSVNLLLQTTLPPLLYQSGQKCELTITGGTHVDMSPSSHALQYCLMRYLKLFGIENLEYDLKKLGVTPNYIGEIQLQVPQITHKLKPVIINEVGEVIKLEVQILTTTDENFKKFSELKEAFSESLRKSFNTEIDINYAFLNNKLKKNYNFAISLISTYKNCQEQEYYRSCFLSKGKTHPEDIEGVIQEFHKLLQQENLTFPGCLDEHHMDQIVIYMALADGKSEILTGPLSLHTQTQIFLLKQFIPDIKIEETQRENGEVLLTIEGIGFQK